MSVTYRLVAPEAPAAAPTLDDDQQRVVDHAGGPLLVIAGPGTGKTTTLVEAISDRIENRGAAPDSVLALTFSRKAAEQLRDRVTVRLGRTTSTTLSTTFHSFAYGLIRRYSPAELYLAPLRLLAAPEQDVILRELLADHPEAVSWPASFKQALGTRGFAREVHDVLSRAREKGLDGRGLHDFGIANDLPEFAAAGLFLEQYLTNLDSQGATDYADLIRRAVIEAEAHRAELRAQFSHVFVDEYQDTDPAQVALLRALAGDGRNLTVVGDPHQSIYAFRGADVRGILDFPNQFRRADGEPADVVTLRTPRRFGPDILRASQAVASKLPGSRWLREGLQQEQAGAALGQRPEGESRSVQALTFETDRAEAEHIADALRRAHLDDEVGWDEMAVLLRSGRSQLPALRRALSAAGVPVEVAGDEVPLVQDPAVAPLLEALRAVLNLTNTDPAHPDYIDAGRAEALLTGPLCGLDASGVRRLARALRAREREGTSGQARTSRELLRAAVIEPTTLDGLSGADVARARALHSLLVEGAESLRSGASAEDALWQLWTRTPWERRLLAQVDAGGAAARRANRDLDAIVALFDAAARAEEQRDHTGVRNFLETLVAQQIPADSLAERGVRGEAVRLLTAHRSKGLEWRLVVVAHVQEEAWPDLRRRSTLLRADRIGSDGVVPPVTTREMLSEERRLFYVACTRAKDRLLVTAVSSGDDDGEQPSRFLTELGVEIEHRRGRPQRPLSVVGLVAELRRAAGDPEADPKLREAAVRRLAALAQARQGARRLVPEADPRNWWGVAPDTRAEVPLRPLDEPVRISASTLKGINDCAAKWFFERDAGGSGASGQNATFGSLVHKVAESLARDELEGALPVTDVDAAVALLMAEVEAVWARLEFRTPWSRHREFERMRVALRNLLEWRAANTRTLDSVETHFSQEVVVADGVTVRLNGYADRIELDADGRVVVVDFKTGKTPPSAVSVKSDAQLALYQLAVDEGALNGDGVVRTAGGAELVQLGMPGSSQASVQSQPAPAPEGPERADLRARLAAVAAMVRAEEFPATPSDPVCRYCQFTAICPAKGAGAVIRQ